MIRTVAVYNHKGLRLVHAGAQAVRCGCSYILPLMMVCDPDRFATSCEQRLTRLNVAQAELVSQAMWCL
jgi:hypothetical protein